MLNIRNYFFLIFAVSGFSGLIYESVWSHYLKLFLGHAAYAQALVIAIFMGGLAIGSWICSRYSVHWKNPLLAYAVVEGVIGIWAISFHQIFEGVVNLSYYTLFPRLSSPVISDVAKWGLGGFLILPPSLLLGMTFPLMSSGVIRRFPDRPGYSLAMLYFANSIGAVFGVLSSIFLLIGFVGLPGTILTAGLLNIGLAIVMWQLQKNRVSENIPCSASVPSSSEISNPWLSFLLLSAMITGIASFIYEIGWIRMLSFVLGSSTHAFELMLSSFILGLALGGLWIRKRIDDIKNPVVFLGLVQVVMGVLAVSTLLFYGITFDVMHKAIEVLSREASAYTMFIFFSAFVCISIMLPATFCAGMTLPLITNILLQKGHGEKSIGLVYAANTIGAIFGVFAAIYIGMPYLGLKGLISFGSSMDIFLGIALFTVGINPKIRKSVIAASIGSLAVLAAISLWVDLDLKKMASGVFRHGVSTVPPGVEVFFYKDGKTSTITLLKDKSGGISISTNGKPDASINMAEKAKPYPDEYTMTMLGSLPLLLHPAAKTAANIGMGSGMTTHTLLSTSQLERLDTVEIEPAMVEAAKKGFYPRVRSAFDDPRSQIHIEDAKTFFSSNNKKYDFIVSEPSNPWVSGISSLFSKEFYHLIKNYLNEDGLFIQWLHLYEINFNLVSSVLKAIELNFSDYTIYFGESRDLIIVAKKSGSLAGPDTMLMQEAGLADALRRININNIQDMELRRIGDKNSLSPIFSSSAYPPNSDYFPILDLEAPKSRFMHTEVSEFMLLKSSPIPLLEMLDGKSNREDTTAVTRDEIYPVAVKTRTAMAIRDFFKRNNERLTEVTMQTRQFLELIDLIPLECSAGKIDLWVDAIYGISKEMIPYLSPAELKPFWNFVKGSPCFAMLSPKQVQWLALLKAVGDRDMKSMAALGTKMLEAETYNEDHERYKYILAATMLGEITQGNLSKASQAWKNNEKKLFSNEQPSIIFRALLAHCKGPH